MYSTPLFLLGERLMGFLANLHDSWAMAVKVGRNKLTGTELKSF